MTFFFINSWIPPPHNDLSNCFCFLSMFLLAHTGTCTVSTCVGVRCWKLWIVGGIACTLKFNRSHFSIRLSAAAPVRAILLHHPPQPTRIISCGLQSPGSHLCLLQPLGVVRLDAVLQTNASTQGAEKEVTSDSAGRKPLIRQ